MGGGEADDLVECGGAYLAGLFTEKAQVYGLFNQRDVLNGQLGARVLDADVGGITVPGDSGGRAGVAIAANRDRLRVTAKLRLEKHFQTCGGVDGQRAAVPSRTCVHAGVLVSERDDLKRARGHVLFGLGKVDLHLVLEPHDLHLVKRDAPRVADAVEARQVVVQLGDSVHGLDRELEVPRVRRRCVRKRRLNSTR